MHKFILFLLLLLPCSVSAIDDQKEIINLEVPFISEAPEKIWSGPWLNGCEEASIAMVDNFYIGKNKVTPKDAAILMNKLFAWQNKIYKSNANSNATRTVEMILKNNLSFKTRIVRDPTLEQIKNELRANRPVISLHYGLDLKNPDLIFRRDGSAYHMVVIKGFDDNTNEFIVHDNGSHKNGVDFRYKYDILMSSLRDYNHKTDKTEKPGTVIFTKQYFTAKVAGNPAIYLIEEGVKKPFPHSGVFKQMGWQFSQVRRVSAQFLENLQNAELAYQQ
ncbi:MAG TPA: C39 family peptidase [Candidatus Magasanikbacteria bacterium]|nr:C39 family peptidase [Candidatus Magasanikbacteria bacterium]